MKYLEEPMEHGVILRRVDGYIATNVPWAVVDHSPDGFEWGYGGSGPSDLALNILENSLKMIGYDGPKTKVWNDSECFSLSYQLHQQFKRDFIASMPEEGGIIPMNAIKDWILQILLKEREKEDAFTS